MYIGADWALELYEVLNEWGILLQAGGWADQPMWYRQTMIRLLQLDNWHTWNADRPSIAGLPNLEAQ